MADPFLQNYDDAELQIASEFLSNWLPFLSRDLCHSCTQKLSHSIRSLHKDDLESLSSPADTDTGSCDQDQDRDNEDALSSNSLAAELSSTCKISWADMSMDNELIPEEETHLSLSGGTSSGNKAKPKMAALSRDQREIIRFNGIERKKDFKCLERVNGTFVNILEGLELHKGIFSAAEQKRIINFVEQLQEIGKSKRLRERTYSAPHKWMRGKGRVTLQFGCCYNYAVDRNGNPPGILKNEMVDPLPHLFKVMIKRLVRWHVVPPSCVPDSCIVNIYEEGDCIPPHIDNHDFVRPFCTVSFLSECEILFGSNLKIVGPGEFAGSYAIPLPVGSVLVLNGNAADVAKHCVPAVPSQRISITFRRMDEAKRPSGYIEEPDLQGIQPIHQEPKKDGESKSRRPAVVRISSNSRAAPGSHHFKP